MKNNIRAMRKQLGMTQVELARATKTSQQQIQRVESGIQSIRFDLAQRICVVLNAPMSAVFPATGRATRQHLKLLNNKLPSNSNIAEELADDIPDIEDIQYTLKYLLRGGHDGLFGIGERTNDRLFELVQRSMPMHNFVVFDSDRMRIALNLDHLIFSHFLFDRVSAGWIAADNKETAEKDSSTILIYTPIQKEPLRFGVNADEVDLKDDPEADEKAQLQNLFHDLEYVHEEHTVVSFVDEDNESVWLRAADIAMATAPLEMVVPSLYQSVLEGDEENEATEEED